MAAAASGHLHTLQYLIEESQSPWNAIDKFGKCAGNYAVDNSHQDCVDFLVDAGVKAELILGVLTRGCHPPSRGAEEAGKKRPVEMEPSTKPDYLSQSLKYNRDGTALLDSDNDAVMMEWERPLMSLHASIITSNQKGKRVLNVGFGMGIIDSILQENWEPSEHVIIEAHPDVYQKMMKDGWGEKKGVTIGYGRWQDVLPKMIAEGRTFDGVFFDTYGEDGSDLDDFHTYLDKIIAKPNGIYSFFNGLAPDNLFFHGVVCQCIKLKLNSMGLDVDFYPCEVEVKEEEWKDVRRKYWHGNTYYLPAVTWAKKLDT